MIEAHAAQYLLGPPPAEIFVWAKDTDNKEEREATDFLRDMRYPLKLDWDKMIL